MLTCFKRVRVLKSTVTFWMCMPLYVIKVISIYLCKQKPTFRTEVGNPTSTSRVLSLLINSFNDFFNIRVPSFVPISHLSVRSISLTSPISFSVTIRILSQLRILQITESFLRHTRVVNIILLRILFTNVDLPAHGSPKWKDLFYK